MVHVLQGRLARSVCLYISHVAHMSLGRVWPSVRVVGWIKMRAGGTRICRTSVAEFMHVKAMIAGS